jgi:hypothetical protein
MKDPAVIGVFQNLATTQEKDARLRRRPLQKLVQ